MTKTPLAALLLLAALLAGCAQADPPTRIVIDFPAPHPDVDDAVPAKDAATAYAQLMAWSRQSGVQVDVREFSFGRCVDAIDGIPRTPGCSQGAEGYWALALNGNASMTGMETVPLAPGDVVAWTYTPLEPTTGETAPAAPQSTKPAAPALAVAAPEPTRNATVVLAGTVDRAVRLTVTNATPVDVAAGPWRVEVPLAHGRTPLRVLADDGRATTARDVVATRLAMASFEAKFTAYPLHDDIADTVWLDLDAHASAPLYAATSATHPPHATVHDLLVAWSEQSGMPIEYGGPGAFGFSVTKVDGVGQPVSAAAPPYWCYTVNGSSDVLGISGQPLAAGDVVAWEYGGCA